MGRAGPRVTRLSGGVVYPGNITIVTRRFQIVWSRGESACRLTITAPAGSQSDQYNTHTSTCIDFRMTTREYLKEFTIVPASHEQMIAHSRAAFAIWHRGQDFPVSWRTSR